MARRDLPTLSARMASRSSRRSTMPSRSSMESASVSEKHLADPILPWDTQVDVYEANELKMARAELLKFNEAVIQRTSEVLANIFLLHGPSLVGYSSYLVPAPTELVSGSQNATDKAASGRDLVDHSNELKDRSSGASMIRPDLSHRMPPDSAIDRPEVRHRRGVSSTTVEKTKLTSNAHRNCPVVDEKRDFEHQARQRSKRKEKTRSQTKRSTHQQAEKDPERVHLKRRRFECSPTQPMNNIERIQQRSLSRTSSGYTDCASTQREKTPSRSSRSASSSRETR